MTMRLLARDDWTTRPPRVRNPHPITSKGGAVEWVVAHHSVTGTEPLEPILRSIQDDHLDDRGWYDIAYNAAVSNVERLAAHCRGPLLQGGATGRAMDPKSLSICAIGDFHTEGEDDPTSALLHNMSDLLAMWIKGGYVSPSFSLRPHNKYSATACCGDRLIKLLPTIEAQAKEKAAGVTPPSTIEATSEISRVFIV